MLSGSSGRHARSQLAAATAPLVAVCALLFAPPAFAQSATEIAAAKQWFSQGIDHEERGRWPEALSLFRRAAEVKRTAPIVFHLGLCLARTGQLVEGALELERSRDLGANDVAAAAAAELADLRPRIPRIAVVFAGERRPLRALLDGRKLALAVVDAPLLVDPGEHQLTFEFEGGTIEKKTRVAEHETVRVVIEAPPPRAVVVAVPTAAQPEPAPSATDKPKGSGGSSTLGWALVGAGGAALVGAGIFAALEVAAYNKIDATCPGARDCNPTDRSTLDGYQSDGKRYQTFAWGLGGLGLVSAGVGGGILLFGGSSPSGRALVAPVVVPGGGGLRVSGAF